MTTAQYIQSAGPGERHFVNQDFVDAVGELYPGTWKKIPLGWHVYTGLQGADEVLFTQHGPVGDLEGQVYEVTWPPVRPEAFFEDILPHIEHTTLKSTAPKMARQRITWDSDLQQKWGTTLAQTVAAHKQAKSPLLYWTNQFQQLDKAMPRYDASKVTDFNKVVRHYQVEGFPAKIAGTPAYNYNEYRAGNMDLVEAARRTVGEMQRFQKKQAARVPSGLYGYTRAIQASCEASVRRLNKQAGVLVSKAIQKDPNVLDFLQVHAKRAKSKTAKILLASYRDSMPKVAADKTAKQYGMYGYPVKTASTGLSMCSALREAAGIIGAELHSRQAAKYAHITGFFTEHSKTAKCGASQLILSVYPDETMSFGKRASEEAPQTVEDWIAWEPSAD